MYSIGDLCDKLIIENIKIFKMREQIHSTKSSKEYVDLFNKMNLLNQNRNILLNLLDDKIEKVINKKEKNRILKVIKTY